MKNAVFGVILLAGCAAGFQVPDSAPMFSRTYQCDVKMEGYDRDGNKENGAELMYFSYKGKTFGVANFKDGDESKLESLTIELGSGETKVLTYDEVVELNLTPCSMLFYSLQH